MVKTPNYWQKACKELSKKDKTLAKIIKAHKKLVLSSKRKPFLTLIKAILGQQVSVAAADAIYARLVEKLARKNISYQNILKLKDAEMRDCGISRQKVLYIKNIAEHFAKNKITNAYFDKKSPEEVREELIAIKGIGNWTMEMFEIFYLNAPDIFPLGDIGLVRALERLYNLETKEEMLEYSKCWQPYRTVVTWFLWAWKDAELVEY